MDKTPRAIFERSVYAGAILRDADAQAAMFTEDGVHEAPLIPQGHPLPRRLEGREAIRAGIGAFHRYPAHAVTVDRERSAYVLHDTADPDVFIAEIDTVVVDGAGHRSTMSLAQIFRVRGGLIVSLRDYFAPG